MKISEMDEKVLKDLNLDQMPDEQKQKMLKRLDEVLMNRFMAKILTSLPEDKQKELEEKVKNAGEDDNEKVFEEAINLHPDAKKVLEESAKEVIEEFKKQPAGGSSQAAVTPATPTPPVPLSTTPDSDTDKVEAEHKSQPPKDKPEPTESPEPGGKSDTDERPGDITPPAKDNTDTKPSTPNPSDSGYYQAG